MASDPRTGGRSRALALVSVAILAVGGSALGALPHAIALVRSGDATYLPDGDGLLYLAWSRGIVLGGADGLCDATHRRSGPMMHPPLLFVPPAKLASTLGLGMVGLGVVWRILAGGMIAVGLFWAIRPLTRGAGLAVGLAAFLVCDPGLLFGQVGRREVEILGSLAMGSRSFLAGVPHLMPHLRVVTPGLALPALLIHLGATLRARLGGGLAWRALAAGSFGLLFSVYFYYWTMIGLGLLLAILCDRRGRRIYLAVLVGGLILGAPAAWSAGQIKRSTPGDWLWRTNKFVAIGHLDELLWPKGLIVTWLASAWWAFRGRPGLIYPWCCTGAGLLCLNHQVVTGLQIENEHWSGAYGVTFSVLLAGLAAPAVDRWSEGSRRRGIALGAIVAGQVAVGFGLRALEATRSDETRSMHALLDRWRDDRATRAIPPGSVVAGDPELLFVAAALGEIYPLSGRLVEFSSRADDAELDERLVLNWFLTGVHREEASRRVTLPPGTLSWESAATRSQALADRQRRRRLGLIATIWADPKPWVDRHEVGWILTPARAQVGHLQGLARLEVVGRGCRAWRVIRGPSGPRPILRTDGKRDLRLSRSVSARPARGLIRDHHPEAMARPGPDFGGDSGPTGRARGNARVMKIVIAEDDAVSRLVLRKALEALNFEVVTFADGVEAWEHLRTHEAQVVITDWMMPGLDGLDLCRRVRVKGARGPYVYMILLTARTSREDRLKALQAGADDFLTKPLDRAELFARLNVARRIVNMEEQLRTRSAELERMHAELEKRNALLAEIASCDGLTGLKNHRYFRESLEAQFVQARRRGLPLSVVMLDVDQFKPFNDSFGHPAGDDVLRDVAALLRSCVREHDVVARYGGEEFAVLLPATDVEASRMLGERLRDAIERHDWKLRPITISLGVSTMTPRVPRASVLIEQADRSLYQSKAEGRNRLTHSRDLCSTAADRRAHLAIVDDSESAPLDNQAVPFIA